MEPQSHPTGLQKARGVIPRESPAKASGRIPAQSCPPRTPQVETRVLKMCMYIYIALPLLKYCNQYAWNFLYICEYLWNHLNILMLNTTYSYDSLYFCNNPHSGRSYHDVSCIQLNDVAEDTFHYCTDVKFLYFILISYCGYLRIMCCVHDVALLHFALEFETILYIFHELLFLMNRNIFETLKSS